MNRRDLLKYVGAAGAFALLGPIGRHTKTARAAAAKQRRLILVMAQGGWDTTYALDPKSQSASVDVPAGAVQRFGGLDIFTDASRPNVTSYFTKYAPITAVVRGIETNSVAHSECAKRMSTGTREETRPDMGAIVAHDNGNTLPLPYLVLGDTAFAGEYAVSTGRLGVTNQIIALLDPNQQYVTGGETPLVVSAGEDELLRKYAAASADRVRATRGANGYNARRVADFVEAIDRGQRLQGVRAGFGKRGKTLAIDNQVALALDALEQQISHAVMLNTRLSWDTHDTNSDQAGFHDSTFAALTTLVDELARRPGGQPGTKMLDDTTIVVYSEMGRTPRLNAAAGKDHWPVTTAMVIGAGVAGGAAYGASTADIQPRKVDYATGAPDDTNGRAVLSANFVAGVLELCGVDPATHLDSGVVPFSPFIA